MTDFLRHNAGHLSLAVALLVADGVHEVLSTDETEQHGWAYVTDVHREAQVVRSKSRTPQCRVKARLPQRPLDAAPKASDEPSSDAVDVGATVDDPFDHCLEYVHTWQPVTFPRGHLECVTFDWPQGRVSFGFLLGVGTVGFIIAYLVRERVLARRKRRALAAR
jgi:hypothetical protein